MWTEKNKPIFKPEETFHLCECVCVFAETGSEEECYQKCRLHVKAVYQIPPATHRQPQPQTTLANLGGN